MLSSSQRYNNNSFKHRTHFIPICSTSKDLIKIRSVGPATPRAIACSHRDAPPCPNTRFC